MPAQDSSLTQGVKAEKAIPCSRGTPRSVVDKLVEVPPVPHTTVVPAFQNLMEALLYLRSVPPRLVDSPLDVTTRHCRCGTNRNIEECSSPTRGAGLYPEEPPNLVHNICDTRAFPPPKKKAALLS